MKKTWVKILLAGILFVALCTLSFWVGTLRSKNSIEAYKDQLRAAGEKLELSELIPPHMDPASNSVEVFRTAARLLGTGFSGVVQTNPPALMRIVAPGKAMVASWQPELRDAYSPSMTNSWSEFDADLGTYAGVLDVLHKIPDYPRLDFNPDYRNIQADLFQYLAPLKRSTLLLSAAAICELHRGDSTAATANLHTLLVIDKTWDEPILISQLVRLAINSIAFAEQWEFLQSTNVSDAELEVLQNDWEKMVFVPSMEHALETDRVLTTSWIGQLRSSNDLSGAIPWGRSRVSGGGSGNWLDDLKEMGQWARQGTAAALWRGAWSYSDELDVLRGEQILLETARQVETNGFFRDALSERERRFKAFGLDNPKPNWLRDHLDAEFAAIGFGSINSARGSIDKILVAEVSRELAITAIALKRYRLRHGSYPDDLNSLVPEFLPSIPRDPMDGKPLRYRRDAAGTFTLYSIGQDGTDDGGDPTPAAARGKNWFHGRDWVWPQPATAQEVEDYYDHLSQ